MVIVQPVHCSSLLQLRFKIFPCSPHPLLFSNMSHIWAVLLLSHLHLRAARMKYGWFQSPSSPAAAPPRWCRTHKPAVPIVYSLSFGYIGRRKFSFYFYVFCFPNKQKSIHCTVWSCFFTHDKENQPASEFHTHDYKPCAWPTTACNALLP